MPDNFDVDEYITQQIKNRTRQDSWAADPCPNPNCNRDFHGLPTSARQALGLQDWRNSSCPGSWAWIEQHQG